MTTGAVWHEKYMWWDTRHAGASIPAGGWLEPDEHADNPRTKRRLKNLLDATGLSERLQACGNAAARRPRTSSRVLGGEERGGPGIVRVRDRANGRRAGRRR